MADERVAVTVWGERVSPLLDASRQALLLDLEQGRVVGRRQLSLPDGSGEAKLVTLRRHGVSTLLCGAASRELAARAAALGLELVPFLAGEVEVVIAAFLAGRLPDDALALPGCRARRRRGGGWRRLEGSDTGPERSAAMPNRDGTGPQGKGAGSGGGRGPCGGGRGGGRGQGGQKGQGGRGGGPRRGPGRGGSSPPPGTGGEQP